MGPERIITIKHKETSSYFWAQYQTCGESSMATFIEPTSVEVLPSTRSNDQASSQVSNIPVVSLRQSFSDRAICRGGSVLSIDT